jgi:hypothetical protein
MADIIPTPKKNVILDATSLSSLMSCGRYYDIRFNHRLVSVRGKSNSLEVGSLIHKVLEVYYKHKIGGFPTNTSIGQALAAGQLFINGCPHCAGFIESDTVRKPTCNHEVDEYPGMTNTPEQSSGYVTGWTFAMKTCEQYFEHYKNDAFIPLSVENVDGRILYEDDEIRVMWKAKFDLVIDTNQIGIVSMDHKTFKQRRDKSSLSNQFMGQCHLLRSRNVIVNKIGLQSTLKIEERLTREVISFSADRLDEWQSETLPYYAYRFLEFAESGYWPPDYTHCDTMFGPCPYKGVCEADRGMREEELRMNFIKAPIWDPTKAKEE